MHTAVEAILNRLPAGWDAPSSLPDDFLHVWKERLGRVEKTTSGANWVEFIADLGEIHLRGTGDCYCLLVSGSAASLSASVKQFINRVAAPGRLVFVLAGSSTALAAASHCLSDTVTFVIVDPLQLKEALNSPQWKKVLGSCIRRYVPIRGLIAFDVALSAEGGMFYGRGDELARLRDEVKVNFAIAGPGKIGKTSLVKQYMRGLVKQRRSFGTYYVDFYECTDRSPHSWPRFLAMKVDGSSKSDKVTREDLPNFIRRLRSKIGQTPHLILDEMDDIVAQNENTKQLLASIEKQELCRFIFCGRGELYNAARNSQTGLGGRFRLMRLEPLDDQSARRLLLEPLDDLGLTFHERDKIADHVLRRTGRRPQLIQFYGQNLAEAAIRSGTNCITWRHIEDLDNDFETAVYFTSPLEDLMSPSAKFIAYAAMQDNSSQMPLSALHSLAKKLGVEFSIEDLKRLCDELVIMNILTWTMEGYQLANEAIRYYVNRYGYLETALSAAKDDVLRRRQLAQAAPSGTPGAPR